MKQYGYKLDEDGDVVLTMTQATFMNLQCALSYATGSAMSEKVNWIEFVQLADKLNAGNPNYRSYLPRPEKKPELPKDRPA